MYIKEVELKNFKSFGRSVRVPLKNDFVTVTGPNGSGKSNIVDALLFALCLSSSRAMRAERLPDLSTGAITARILIMPRLPSSWTIPVVSFLWIRTVSKYPERSRSRATNMPLLTILMESPAARPSFWTSWLKQA